MHHKLQCTLPKSKPDNIYITCQIDHPNESSDSKKDETISSIDTYMKSVVLVNL